MSKEKYTKMENSLDCGVYTAMEINTCINIQLWYTSCYESFFRELYAF